MPLSAEQLRSYERPSPAPVQPASDPESPARRIVAVHHFEAPIYEDEALDLATRLADAVAISADPAGYAAALAEAMSDFGPSPKPRPRKRRRPAR